MSNLNQELDYYISHQREIVDRYNGQVVVIHDRSVVGAYPTELEATADARKKFKLGEFLVQHVAAGTDAFTQTFYSRVAAP